MKRTKNIRIRNLFNELHGTRRKTNFSNSNGISSTQVLIGILALSTLALPPTDAGKVRWKTPRGVNIHGPCASDLMEQLPSLGQRGIEGLKKVAWCHSPLIGHNKWQDSSLDDVRRDTRTNNLINLRFLGRKVDYGALAECARSIMWKDSDVQNLDLIMDTSEVECKSTEVLPLNRVKRMDRDPRKPPIDPKFVFRKCKQLPPQRRFRACDVREFEQHLRDLGDVSHHFTRLFNERAVPDMDIEVELERLRRSALDAPLSWENEPPTLLARLSRHANDVYRRLAELESVRATGTGHITDFMRDLDTDERTMLTIHELETRPLSTCAAVIDHRNEPLYTVEFPPEEEEGTTHTPNHSEFK